MRMMGINGHCDVVVAKGKALKKPVAYVPALLYLCVVLFCFFKGLV